MRWPWVRRAPQAPQIQPFKLPIDLKPLEPRDPDYVVEQTEMSQTGMWRIFPWTKKKDEPKE